MEIIETTVKLYVFKRKLQKKKRGFKFTKPIIAL